MATWEDLDSLRQQFPRVSAWGQADFQEEEIVNTPVPPSSGPVNALTPGKAQDEALRPKRKTQLSTWLAGNELGRK
jgi:hypothetical protein